MTEYERGFIDGIKSKVSAELTPTLINVSKTMLEMLEPVLSTALENALNDNNVITDTDIQPVRCGEWEEIEEYGGWGDTYFRCSICGDEWDLDAGTPVENGMKYCPNCGARMMKEDNDEH